MILLDTHIWVWWVQEPDRLSDRQKSLLAENELSGKLGVSAISLWEIAKLVEIGRLVLPCPAESWLTQALAYPGITLLPITAEIAVASTRLPDSFHRDPADQIIVATARVLDCPLMTINRRIMAYQHVKHMG